MSIYAVAIPKWGIEMEQGTVNEWRAEVGDTVSKGEELADIESDKIVNILEATGDGVLRRRFAEVGDALQVGELIGIIADATESEASIDAFVAEFKASGSSDEAGSGSVAPSGPTGNSPAEKSVEPTPQAAPANNAPGKVRVSPPVRRKAAQLGVDIDSVVGSGPNGRITSADVERAASSAKPSESATPSTSSNEPFNVVSLGATQKTTGRRLLESKQSIPHYYLHCDIELDGLLANRQALSQGQQQKVSINSMLVWCVAKALKAVPQINAQLVGDELRQYTQANVAIAVATERGLMTPVVAGACSKSPLELAAAITELVNKANSGSLERHELEGGSFTVSNLGMYGVKSFEAIINPPQVAILALGQGQKQLVVRDDDQTAVAQVLRASLSCDHRVVDGAVGGQFLTALKREVESLA